jgi:hypothetical protein
MTTHDQSTEINVSQENATDISNPDLSFSDYERIRRGETVTKGANQPAPEAKPSEQKKTESGGGNDEDDNESDLDVDSEDESSDELQGGKPAKKKGGFQRRIDKLNSQKSEAQREAEYWKAKALEKAPADQKSESVETKADGRPNSDDFETHAEYIEALTDWKLDQREKKSKEQDNRSKVEQKQAELRKSSQERMQAFAEKKPDFYESLVNLDHVTVTPSIEQLVIQSELGPEILYALAKDPKEAERICALEPIAAAREFGKLEAKISSQSDEPKKEIKKTTSAPKPIEPVGKSGSAPVSKKIDDPDLSFPEYEQLRREQMKSKR